MFQKPTTKQRAAIVITVLWVIFGLMDSYNSGLPQFDIPSQFYFETFLKTTAMPLIILWGGYWIFLGKKENNK